MLAIDPMHNLFLGTGKHLLQFWLDNEIIHRRQFPSIQTYVDRMIVPTDVGRIPYKIVSGFSSFTADQFKNWIILFSVPALYDILPQEHFQCWQHFVLACRVLCKHQLSQSDIDLFGVLLIRFCQRAQALYGEHFVTPNMHMHAHLKSVVEDYGPVFGYWLFSFERYNAILGNQSNNHRDIESQLLNRFLRDNFIYSVEFPQEFCEDFKGVCSAEESLVGSLHETTMSDMISGSVEVASCSRRGVLDGGDSVLLLQLYKKLKPGASCTVPKSKDVIGKPAQVWCCNQFETGGISSFLPVHYLQTRCAHGVRKLGDSDESVMVVVPLVN